MRRTVALAALLAGQLVTCEGSPSAAAAGPLLSAGSVGSGAREVWSGGLRVVLRSDGTAGVRVEVVGGQREASVPESTAVDESLDLPVLLPGPGIRYGSALTAD